MLITMEDIRAGGGCAPGLRAFFSRYGLDIRAFIRDGGIDADKLEATGDALAIQTGAAVDCISTHVSLVFLAGEKVFKLKKAIRFPYLDFSTPERRLAYCEREGIPYQVFEPKEPARRSIAYADNFAFQRRGLE